MKIFLMAAAFLAVETDIKAQSSENPEHFIKLSAARIVDFKGVVDNGKVKLDWLLGENEKTDRIEVEKSADNGKSFTMAGLVFGTDESKTEAYRFFDSVLTTDLVSYRLKIVNKDQKITYSTIITIIKK